MKLAPPRPAKWPADIFCGTALCIQILLALFFDDTHHYLNQLQDFL